MSWGNAQKVEEVETCERVDDEAEDHGDHRDEDPMREPLVLHAAIDGDGRFMALEQAKTERKSPEKKSRNVPSTHS